MESVLFTNVEKRSGGTSPRLAFAFARHLRMSNTTPGMPTANRSGWIGLLGRARPTRAAFVNAHAARRATQLSDPCTTSRAHSNKNVDHYIWQCPQCGGSPSSAAAKGSSAVVWDAHAEPVVLVRRLNKSSIIHHNQMWFRRIYYKNLNSRRVLVGTVGAPHPRCWDAIAKTHLNTPKAVTYHEQSHCYRFMIGHSLGRMESRCCLQAILILL